MSDNNMDWGLDDFDAPEQPMAEDTPPQQGNPPQVANNQNNGQEVPPVKLSRGMTGLLIVGVLIIVVIILITIKGCSVEKTTNTPPNQGGVNSAVTSGISGSANGGGNGVNNPDISVVSSPTGSTPSENPNTPNNTQGVGGGTSTPIVNPNPVVSIPSETPSGSGSSVINDPPTISDDILTEVGVPQLSNEIETNGIVVGKHVYYYKGSYVYGVYVSILFGDATKSVYYFCPKRTFDALSSADAIKVTYSFDSAGNVSITSITK